MNEDYNKDKTEVELLVDMVGDKIRVINKKTNYFIITDHTYLLEFTELPGYRFHLSQIYDNSGDPVSLEFLFVDNTNAKEGTVYALMVLGGVGNFKYNHKSPGFIKGICSEIGRFLVDLSFYVLDQEVIDTVMENGLILGLVYDIDCSGKIPKEKSMKINLIDLAGENLMEIEIERDQGIGELVYQGRRFSDINTLVSLILDKRNYNL